MCVSILLIPFFVFTLTPNNEPSGWSCVFFLLALLLIICNGIFCIFGSGYPATFTKVSINNKKLLEQTKPIIKNNIEKTNKHSEIKG